MVGGAIACDLAEAGFNVALVEKKLPDAFKATSPPDIRVSSLNLASEDYLRKLKAWSGIKSMRLSTIPPSCRLGRSSESLAQLVPASLKKTTFDAASFGHSHLGHFVENHVIQLALQEVLE